MGQHRQIDRSRRAFLKAPLTGSAPGSDQTTPWRPPWSAADFESACTQCGACIEACPEQILTAGDGGFPEVDVAQGTGECTFCQACVDACPEPAFLDPEQSRPWDRIARIGDGCLAHKGVHCQTCGDVCDWQAIRFVPEVGAPPQPQLDPESCTGCGACSAACPAQAIAIVPPPSTVTREQPNA